MKYFEPGVVRWVFLGGVVGALVGCLALGAVTHSDASAGETGVAPSQEVGVPAGQFLMGCSGDISSIKCDNDAAPIHAVYVDTFYIDKTEVTNAQYASCVAAGACASPLGNESASREHYYDSPVYANYPVIQVDWPRANAYCAWQGKRLPTEAEWEKAARGADLRLYPWGNEPVTCARANYRTWEGNCVWDTTAVGMYAQGASPYGALDMAGNVREWVNDLYEKPYYAHSPYFNPRGPEITDKMESLVRGGSWNDDANNVNTWVRIDEKGIYAMNEIGFRCARSAGAVGTPTPTPVPSPTATSLPATISRTVGLEGGLLWQAYAGHLTLIQVPSGVVSEPVTLTLSYDQRSNQHGVLQGVDHFFSVEAAPAWSANVPVSVTVAYPDRQPIVQGTLGVYQLSAGQWVTQDVFLTHVLSGALQAQIEPGGAFGLLGQAQRAYLPFVLRTH